MGGTPKHRSLPLALAVLGLVFIGMSIYFAKWLANMSPLYEDVLCSLKMAEQMQTENKTTDEDLDVRFFAGMMCHNPNAYNIVGFSRMQGDAYIGEQQIPVPGHASVPLTALVAKGDGYVPFQFNAVITPELRTRLTPDLLKDEVPVRLLVSMGLIFDVAFPLHSWKVKRTVLKACGVNMCNLTATIVAKQTPMYTAIRCADSFDELKLVRCTNNHESNKRFRFVDFMPDTLEEGEHVRDTSLGLPLGVCALLGIVFCAAAGWNAVVKPKKRKTRYDRQESTTESDSNESSGASDSEAYRPNPAQPAQPAPVRHPPPDFTLLQLTDGNMGFFAAASQASSPEALMQVLQNVRSACDAADRSKFMRAQMLHWHPDKHPNKEFAKQMFQLLQQSRDWFVSSDTSPPAPKRKACPSCLQPLDWTNFSGGAYATGWTCNNVRRCRQSSANTSQWRWFCERCQNDYCHNCYAPMAG